MYQLNWSKIKKVDLLIRDSTQRRTTEGAIITETDNHLQDCKGNEPVGWTRFLLITNSEQSKYLSTYWYVTKQETKIFKLRWCSGSSLTVAGCWRKRLLSVSVSMHSLSALQYQIPSQFRICNCLLKFKHVFWAAMTFWLEVCLCVCWYAYNAEHFQFILKNAPPCLNTYMYFHI